jgi:hypothetical protein
MKPQPTLAALLFLLGCATGGAASHYVSSANAQPHPGAAATARWEYKCVSAITIAGVNEAANQLGSQGFELVTGAPAYCFKRSLR